MKKYWLTTAARLAILLPIAAHAQTATTPQTATDTTPATTTVPAADTSASGAAPEEVIVTGTRQLNRTKNDSPAPVDVISGAALQATGEQNVFDALAKVLPSLDLPPIGFDTAGLTRAARLRGLSPDDTLVLVDGKRRHVTANIAADIGPVGGSDPVDLDMIPISLIDHIEVLRDGAAAQYGSDAIAGVINIILKHKDHGGDAYAQEGCHLRAGWLHQQPGRQHGNVAGRERLLRSRLRLPLSRSYQPRRHLPVRSLDRIAVACALGLPVFVVPNKGTRASARSRGIRAIIWSISATTRPTTRVRSHIYSFATYGYRHSEAFENYRDPNTSCAYSFSRPPLL